MRWRGVFSGVLVLTALQAIVSSTSSASRFGAIFTSTDAIVRHALSPFEPAIPDLRTRKGTPPEPPRKKKKERPDAPVVPTQPGTGSGETRI